MRLDMAKVIVERPRYGGGYKYPRGKRRYRKPIDTEDDTGLPQFEGIRKPWTSAGTQKGLNENLNPLLRFLQSRVGRPWNEVYSEIRANLRVDSAVQLHVIQHLEDFVELNVRMIEGVPYGIRWKGWEPLSENGWWGCFYVHPETCLLMASPRRKRQHYNYRSPYATKKCPYERVTIGRMNRAFKIDGHWYEITLMPICQRHATQDDRVDVQDVLLPELSRPSEFWDYYGGPYYAVKKRQMNSRAIRQLIIDSLIIPARRPDPSFANSQGYNRFHKRFRTWGRENGLTKRRKKQSPPCPNR